MRETRRKRFETSEYRLSGPVRAKKILAAGRLFLFAPRKEEDKKSPTAAKTAGPKLRR
jgi:hypothetical protein